MILSNYWRLIFTMPMLCMFFFLVLMIFFFIYIIIKFQNLEGKKTRVLCWNLKLKGLSSCLISFLVFKDEFDGELFLFGTRFHYVCVFFSRAAAIPRAKGGSVFQMKLVYSHLAPLFLLLLQWMDCSCSCFLHRYLNLFHIIIYKVS